MTLHKLGDSQKCWQKCWHYSYQKYWHCQNLVDIYNVDHLMQWRWAVYRLDITPEMNLSLLFPRVLCRIQFLPIAWWVITYTRTSQLRCGLEFRTWNKLPTHVWHPFSRHIYDLFWRPFLLPHYLPVHWYFYPSTSGFTCPNDRWTDLCMKLCSLFPFCNNMFYFI